MIFLLKIYSAVIGIGMISVNPADQGSWSCPRETPNLATLSDDDE